MFLFWQTSALQERKTRVTGIVKPVQSTHVPQGSPTTTVNLFSLQGTLIMGKQEMPSG